MRAYDTDINLTGSHTLLKFVNVLSPEYNHQRQSMEEHDTLTREIVVGWVRKRFESTLFKQELAKGKKTPSGDQALAAKGEPGKPGGGRCRGKPKKSQDPGRDGGGGQGKSGNSSTRQEPWRCFICKKTRHVARFCPEKHCELCGKKGHTTYDCPKNAEESSMAVS